jgi:hypothetical protein
VPAGNSWRALECSLVEYERSTQVRTHGAIRLVGNAQAASALSGAGFDARQVPPTSLELFSADVVVIDTSLPDWKGLAEALRGGASDVLLLAGQGAGLEQLLDAMAMRLELVGFAGPSVAILAERIRSCLIRRAMDEAREQLNHALREVKASLKLPVDIDVDGLAFSADAALLR